MFYNKSQRQLIKSIIKYKPEGTEESFEKPLKNYFNSNKNFKDIDTEIQKDKVILKISDEDYKNKYNEKYLLILEILIALNSLIENNLILFTKHDKPEVVFKIENNEKNINEIIIKYDNSNLIKVLNHKWIISNDLRALKNRFFMTLEGRNLAITQIALGASIFLSLLGIVADYYIAEKIPTEIKFKNPNVLKKNIDIGIKLEENFIEKTKLKLEFQQDINE